MSAGLILDTVNRSLEMKLSGAVATNELIALCSYADVNQTTFAMTGQNTKRTPTTGATAVTIAAAPGATTSRRIKYLSIPNIDTAAVTLTLQWDDTGTKTQICAFTLAVGDVLFADDGTNPIVIDSTGHVKTTGGVNGPGSSTDNALARWNGTAGNAIQNSGWTLADTEVLTAGGNVALGANYISRAGTAAGLSLDASNNATLSDALTLGGGITLSTFVNLAITAITSTGASSLIRVKGSTGDQWQYGAGILVAGDWGLTNSTRGVNPIVVEGGTATPTVTLSNALVVGGNLTVSGGTVNNASGNLTISSTFTNGSVVISPIGTGFVRIAGGSNNLLLDGRLAVAGESVSASSGIVCATGTTALSSLRIPHGVAPTSPVDGDVWSTTTTLNFRLNGTTKTVVFL